MDRILVCDDEYDIVQALKIYLSAENYEVLTASNGREALSILERETVHLVLLDIMMPELDGIATMHRLRQFSNVPVLLISAKSEDEDKILGLNVGADDYITKPFHLEELLARVRAQLRRYTKLGALPASVLQVGGIVLDKDAKKVCCDGAEIAMTPLEYDILQLLMEAPNRVFSPDEIYQQVWHEAPIRSENVIAVHIRHLREKLEINPAEPRYIKVVWGKGYKMEGTK